MHLDVSGCNRLEVAHHLLPELNGQDWSNLKLLQWTSVYTADLLID